MPRTRQPKPPKIGAPAKESSADETQTLTAMAEPHSPHAQSTGSTEPGPEHGPQERPKHWGPPYKSIYVNREKGFELGEDRQYKQRVFKFRDKPDADVINALKDSGFRYRPAEKSWTIQADAASRTVSEELARQFAGETGRSL